MDGKREHRADAVLDGVYRDHRRQAAAALQVSPGTTVVDVGCGTGASLPGLVEAVGPRGRVVGIDTSAGMLQKAQARVQRHAWKNVDLVEIVATAPVSDTELMAQVGEFQAVHCFLSLSVIDDWMAAFDRWFGGLEQGGRFVIADVHNPKPGLYGRYVQLVSMGSLSRESWQPLQQRSADFELSWQPSSWGLGGQFFVASGTRGDATRDP